MGNNKHNIYSFINNNLVKKIEFFIFKFERKLFCHLFETSLIKIENTFQRNEGLKFHFTFSTQS